MRVLPLVMRLLHSARSQLATALSLSSPFCRHLCRMERLYTSSHNLKKSSMRKGKIFAVFDIAGEARHTRAHAFQLQGR